MVSQIYREPIQVICINSRNSTKLVKGAIYCATSLYSYRAGEKIICIKGIGAYNVNSFTFLDGTSLHTAPDFTTEQPKMIDPKEKNYKGQYVKCRYSSGKSMKEGEIYYVEDQLEIVRDNSSYYGSSNKYIEYKLKIRGIKNKVSPYNFNEIDIIQQRYIKLKNLKGDKIKTGDQTRKFLLYTEKERLSIVFDLLSRVLIDVRSIKNLEDTTSTIIDLMIKKGSKYAIIKEDI